MTTDVQSYKELLEEVPCNICGADDYEVIYEANYASAKPDEIINAFRSSGDELLFDQMVQCNRCKLKYLNPRLKQNIIIEGYSLGSDEQFVSQAKGRELTSERCLNIIEKVQSQKGKIFDIGTAGGSFLAVAKRRGWEVAGCEPNRWLTEWCREHYDIDIHAGTVFDMDIPGEEYDVVTLWDVLEHVPDPYKVLKECYRILKPNGLLIVNYPDISASIAKVMGRKWVFLLSVHLYYFNKQSMRKLLDKAGFTMFKHKMHWQSLELDYIFFRMKAYVKGLADFGRKAAKACGLQKAQVPYWVGQSLAMARKKSE